MKENTSIRLKRLMKERNIKQVDILNLAKQYCAEYSVKMNKSDISQYVSGKVEPSQEKLIVLSRALGVSESWLMGLDVEENDLYGLMKDSVPEDEYELFKKWDSAIKCLKPLSDTLKTAGYNVNVEYSNDLNVIITTSFGAKQTFSYQRALKLSKNLNTLIDNFMYTAYKLADDPNCSFSYLSIESKMSHYHDEEEGDLEILLGK